MKKTMRRPAALAAAVMISLGGFAFVATDSANAGSKNSKTANSKGVSLHRSLCPTCK